MIDVEDILKELNQDGKTFEETMGITHERANELVDMAINDSKKLLMTTSTDGKSLVECLQKAKTTNELLFLICSIGTRIGMVIR